MRAAYEVADVLNKHWYEVEHYPQINSWQLRTLGAIKRCRTIALGGHMDSCTACGSVRLSYNSCRNRHCPKCQGSMRERWIEKREEDLLSVPYFHVVFTLPDTLNQLALQQPSAVYSTLFEASWQTIKTFGSDAKHLGAAMGMISILHTWGQTLSLHPHVHCIIPGGGLTEKDQWKATKNKGQYLFPVKALSKVFRAKYVAGLKSKIPHVDKRLIDILFKKDWVVYAKKPFANAQVVIEYLGRYTHKVAISNHRIKNMDNKQVTISYKDYRKGGEQASLTLEGIEFIRRFSMHILPRGFVRIRHYGILSSSGKKRSLAIIRLQTKAVNIKKKEARKPTNYNPKICVCCKKETMVTIAIFTARGPPTYLQNIQNRIQKKD